MPSAPYWRAIVSALLVGLFSGCTYSDVPLLPQGEALNNEAFTGRFAVSNQGQLEYWDVVRQGDSYLVTKVSDKKESYNVVLHSFDGQFSLLQGASTDDQGGQARYHYLLAYIGPNYLLFELIDCDAGIAREAKLDVEKASAFSCRPRTKDQLMTLARRTAAQFYDPSHMVAALRASESGGNTDQ